MRDDISAPVEPLSRMPWYACAMPRALLLGGLLFLVVAIYTTALSFAVRDPLVSDNVERESAAINQELERDRVAAVLGLRAVLRYDPATGRLHGRIDNLGWTQAAEQFLLPIPAPGAVEEEEPEPDPALLNPMDFIPERPPASRLYIQLLHPVRPARDIRLVAQLHGEGDFAVDLPALEHTRWRVVVEDERRLWRLTGTWRWPEQEEVTLGAAE